MATTSSTSAITVSLEWAKKLKEAGYPQGSTHYLWGEDGWKLDGKKDVSHNLIQPKGDIPYKDGGKIEDGVYQRFYAAPTAEEILRRLPYSYEKKVNRTQKAVVYITVHREKQGWQVRAHSKRTLHWASQIDTLANAAAAMYCYLSSNNLLP